MKLLLRADPNYEYTDTTVLEEQAQKAEEQAYTVYNTVYNWEQTTSQIDNTVKNNEAKLEEIAYEENKIDLEEKAAAQAEQPNPVGTLTRKHKKAELKKEKEQVKKNIQKLNEVKDAARPTVAEAKTRKRKAKRAKEAPAVLETAPKEIKDQAQRAEVNSDLEAVFQDETIPQTQKDKALRKALDVNQPIIGKIAGQLAAKHGANTKEVRDLVEGEAGRRMFETGKIDKNTWNTAQTSVARLLRKERETVKRALSEKF